MHSLTEKRSRQFSCDYSFHVSPVEWNKNTEQEIKDCIVSGITSFKVYMAYKGVVGLDDVDLKKLLKTLLEKKVV